MGTTHTTGDSRVHELLADNARPRDEVARLNGQIEVLKERLSTQDAADEHHRAELDSVRVGAADALGDKEAQVRIDKWRHRLSEAEERRELAERQREQAEQERAAGDCGDGSPRPQTARQSGMTRDSRRRFMIGIQV